MNEVLTLDRFHESKFNETRKLLGRVSGSKLPPLLPTPTTFPTGPKAQHGRLPPSESHTVSSNTLRPRRISATEARAGCEKGLCYYCDENFVPGRKCKYPQIFLFDDELRMNTQYQ